MGEGISYRASFSLLPHNPRLRACLLPVYLICGSSILRRTCCLSAHFSCLTMGKTSASTRAGNKGKPKRPDRKWCTCQERCNGGKEVAASTYRSHNPTTRDGFSVGDKRKAVAVGGEGESDSESRVRETRRMRARRLAQNGETAPRLSLTVAEDEIGKIEIGDSRTGLRGRKKVTVRISSAVSYRRAEKPGSSLTITRLGSMNTPKATKTMNRCGSHLWTTTTLSKTERRSTEITKRTTSFGLPYVLSTRWCLLYSPGTDDLVADRLLHGQDRAGNSCAFVHPPTS